MSRIIIYLGRLLPVASSDLPEGRPGRPVAFYLSCFGWGLHSFARYRTNGSLLHCHSTLTGLSRRFLFYCTSLGVTSTGRYPASCPAKPGLSSPHLCGPRLFILLATFLYCSTPSVIYQTWKQLPPTNSLQIEL